MQTPTDTNRPPLVNALIWLITPASHITDPAEKRATRFALIAALVLLGLSILRSFFQTSSAAPENVVNEAWITIGVSAIAFLVTKFTDHRFGAGAISIALFAEGFLSAISRESLTTLLYYYPWAIVLGSAFLPSWFILGATGANIAVLFLLPAFGFKFSDEPLAVAGAMLVTGVILFVVMRFKGSVERIRFDELTIVNKELLSIRKDLETRVEERTVQLNRRSAQLEASALVARSAAEFRSLQDVIDNVVNQITERFGYYHAGLFMTDVTGKFVVLQATSSEGGKRMLARGHRLEIGQGLVGSAAYEKRPKLAQDVGIDAIYFNNPDLPDTHSEVALPLLVQNKPIGVLDIQSEESNAFGMEDLFTLQLMADQVALAIQNASLLAESQTAVEQLQNLMSRDTEVTWRERLKKETVGFTYTPLGLRPIMTTDSAITKSGKTLDGDKKIQVPIRLRGRKIGVISLKRKQNEINWSDKELEFTEKVADQIALAVENARLLEESQRRAIREQTINDLSARLSRSLDIETLLQNAVRELHKLPQIADVSVYVAPQQASEE